MKRINYIMIQLLICSALMAQTDTFGTDSTRDSSDSIRSFEMITIEDINSMPVMNVDEILSMHIGVMIRTREIHIHGHGPGEIVYIVDGVDSSDPYTISDATDVGIALGSVGDVNADYKVDLCDAIRIINYIFDDPDDVPADIDFYDTDCDGEIDARDVIRILNYLYCDGNAPGDLDGDDVIGH